MFVEWMPEFFSSGGAASSEDLSIQVMSPRWGLGYSMLWFYKHFAPPVLRQASVFENSPTAYESRFRYQ